MVWFSDNTLTSRQRVKVCKEADQLGGNVQACDDRAERHLLHQRFQFTGMPRSCSERIWSLTS